MLRSRAVARAAARLQGGSGLHRSAPFALPHAAYTCTGLVVVGGVCVLAASGRTAKAPASVAAAAAAPATPSEAALDDLGRAALDSLAALAALLPSPSPAECEGRPRDPTAMGGDHGKKSPVDGDKALVVKVDLEAEVVDELPLMALADVQATAVDSGEDGGGKLYVCYEGIVYDVTDFANEHPGGREMLLSATGKDLSHFFENYTVHGMSDKASNWLAPLAVGKLSAEEAATAKALSTPEAHVRTRMKLLGHARRKLLAITTSLPLWMSLRSLVRLVGWGLPSLGRWIAACLPVTVPGLSPGAEPLRKGGRVAVVGGGIAGCGAAWALARDGYEVVLYEGRGCLAGNARTFDWTGFAPGTGCENTGVDGTVKSCVSVTAWPPVLYKNYTALLAEIGVETTAMPLSWFLNSKVKGAEGFLWAADPAAPEGSLRKRFASDFYRYGLVESFVRRTTQLYTMDWAPWKWNNTFSMYANHTGLGLFNPFNVVPLYTLCRLAGVSQTWWDVVFTPHYTASFLVDELRPFPAVFGPLIEAQIPLNPTAAHSDWKPGAAGESATDCKLKTCVTWKDAGVGIREVFAKLTKAVDVRTSTRVLDVVVLPDGRKRVRDEHDGVLDVDRVIFAMPCTAVGNILKGHGQYEETILSSPVYADDHHPAAGHMHAVMHSDPTVIAPEYRTECLTRASNYVEVTELKDGSINIENQYNFGVQTPGPGVAATPLDKKPVMLISHALGEGKSIDPKTIRGTGNHARAHPLYSGWNVMAMLSLRLIQGKDGVYYCSNWTTPGNCHDMSLLSGFACAHACGAKYPFPKDVEAKKDFGRLRDLMGI